MANTGYWKERMVTKSRSKDSGSVNVNLFVSLRITETGKTTLISLETKKSVRGKIFIDNKSFEN